MSRKLIQEEIDVLKYTTPILYFFLENIKNNKVVIEVLTTSIGQLNYEECFDPNIYYYGDTHGANYFCIGEMDFDLTQNDNTIPKNKSIFQALRSTESSNNPKYRRLGWQGLKITIL